MRPHFIFFPPGLVTHYNETTLYTFFCFDWMRSPDGISGYRKKRDRKTSFFLYKAYYAKHRGFLLRKHCKEGATVVTQFSTHNFLECYFIFIIYKNPKKLRKIWKFKNIFFLSSQPHLFIQTMSTGFKNEFWAVSGQKRHLRPKLSSPGQYGLNHVDQV